jgi:hypothetical protein
MCGSGIFIGGYLQGWQDTRNNLKITREGRDLTAKRRGPSSSFGPWRTGAHRGGGGPGASNRRRSGELGARVAGAGGRGDREDSGVLLTLERENSRAAGGGRQWRPAAAPRGGDGPMRLR